MSPENTVTIQYSTSAIVRNALTYFQLIGTFTALLLLSWHANIVLAKQHGQDSKQWPTASSENNSSGQKQELHFIQLGSIISEPEHAYDFYDEAYEQEFMPTIPADGKPIYGLPPVEPHGPVILDMPYNGMSGCESCTSPGNNYSDCFANLWAPRPWCWQLLPNNLIYTSYLAGPKEPRLATVWYDDTGPSPIPGRRGEQNGWLWDSTLGGRVSVLRYGSNTELHPQGFEVQLEGAAFVRLDPGDDRDLRSADYRFGIPLVYGIGRWQTKIAYYHNSAHIGDEFYEKYHPLGFDRVNYVRDVIVLGNSYYMYDWLRIYGEAGWSFFNAGGSKPWEFQFGTELIQARPTGIRGAPFFAVNGMTRQELNWGGNVCAQIGWAWRGYQSEKLLLIGFEYLYGSDPQYEFTETNPTTGKITALNQNRAGIGMWYDY
jgi:hypothetical protein